MPERTTKRCPDCGTELPLSEFPLLTKHKGPQAGYQFYGSYCHEHTQQRAERWRANPENYARWLADNHRRNTKRKYGISDTEYDSLYKNARCAGCLRATATQHGRRTFRLVVDHNHATGKIRGLLCHDCNRTIATAHDDPSILRRLAEYLDQSNPF
jgi:adenine-specific DNA methylase